MYLPHFSKLLGTEVDVLTITADYQLPGILGSIVSFFLRH